MKFDNKNKRWINNEIKDNYNELDELNNILIFENRKIKYNNSM